MGSLVILSLLLATSLVGAEQKSYKGYKVLRTGILDYNGTEFLRELMVTHNELDFWREPAPQRAADINVPPHLLDSFKGWLAEEGITFDTINAFIEALAAEHEWANVISIGKSYEGRDMKVLAITKAGPGKPNMWLEAGIHAREWIAPAVATFIIRELVENN